MSVKLAIAFIGTHLCLLADTNLLEKHDLSPASGVFGQFLVKLETRPAPSLTTLEESPEPPQRRGRIRLGESTRSGLLQLFPERRELSADQTGSNTDSVLQAKGTSSVLSQYKDCNLKSTQASSITRGSLPLSSSSESSWTTSLATPRGSRDPWRKELRYAFDLNLAPDSHEQSLIAHKPQGEINQLPRLGASSESTNTRSHSEKPPPSKKPKLGLDQAPKISKSAAFQAHEFDLNQPAEPSHVKVSNMNPPSHPAIDTNPITKRTYVTPHGSPKVFEEVSSRPEIALEPESNNIRFESLSPANSAWHSPHPALQPSSSGSMMPRPESPLLGTRISDSQTERNVPESSGPKVQTGHPTITSSLANRERTDNRFSTIMSLFACKLAILLQGKFKLGNSGSINFTYALNCFTYSILAKRISSLQWTNVESILVDFVKSKHHCNPQLRASKIAEKQEVLSKAIMWISELIYHAFDSIFFLKLRSMCSSKLPDGGADETLPVLFAKYLAFGHHYNERDRLGFRKKILIPKLLTAHDTETDRGYFESFNEFQESSSSVWDKWTQVGKIISESAHKKKTQNGENPLKAINHAWVWVYLWNQHVLGTDNTVFLSSFKAKERTDLLNYKDLLIDFLEAPNENSLSPEPHHLITSSIEPSKFILDQLYLEFIPDLYLRDQFIEYHKVHHISSRPSTSLPVLDVLKSMIKEKKRKNSGDSIYQEEYLSPK